MWVWDLCLVQPKWFINFGRNWTLSKEDKVFFILCIPCVTASNEIAALFSLNEMLVGGQFFSVFFFCNLCMWNQNKIKKKNQPSICHRKKQKHKYVQLRHFSLYLKCHLIDLHLEFISKQRFLTLRKFCDDLVAFVSLFLFTIISSILSTFSEYVLKTSSALFLCHHFLKLCDVCI